jgi:DNA-binding response OmpR family regulator
VKVLLVEDHQDLSDSIKNYLAQEGVICEVAYTVRQAMDKLYGFRYDLILLDLMLPDGDGLTVLEMVKKNWPATGVLILSAKNSLDDRLKGLDLGADDYLPKPFHLAELNARTKAIYRRRLQQGDNKVIFEEITINMDTFEVRIHDALVELTRKEIDLLHYLIVNKGRLLTKQSIAEHLWGDYMDDADSFDFVYQHIKNLRKKIIQAGGNDYIKTVYGAGYKFKSS